MPALDAQVCYLLCFPDPVEKSTEPPEQIRGLKDAPYFQPVDISFRTLGQVQVQAGGETVTVTRQRYDDHVQIVECKFQLFDILGQEAIQKRERIEADLQKQFIPAKYNQNGLFEEYVILMLSTVTTSDAFVESNASQLAHFIRAQREELDAAEISEILGSRVRYSRDDLTIVDWDGAIIIAPDADFQSDIELLKIGNYQLLRYRMLDQSVEASLRDIAAQFRSNPRRALPPLPGVLSQPLERGRVDQARQHGRYHQNHPGKFFALLVCADGFDPARRLDHPVDRLFCFILHRCWTCEMTSPLAPLLKGEGDMKEP
jgi:hypothetical protein